LPDIVFSSYYFEKTDKSGFDLLKLHDKQIPNRSNVIFILLSTDNTISVTSRIVDLEGDGLIIKPVTGKNIKETLVNIINEKTTDAEYYQCLQLAKESIHNEELEKATDLIKQSMELSPTPAMSYYFMAQVYYKQNNPTAALTELKKGLDIDERHYKCLSAIFDHYAQNKQYQNLVEYGDRIYTNYPINPRRIPELIKGYVITAQYEPILKLSEVLSGENGIPDEITKYFAAGFAIAGKLLLKNNRHEEGVKVLINATELCPSNLKVVENIVDSLIEAKLMKPLNDILKNVDQDIRSSDPLFKIIEFKIKANNPRFKPLQIVKSASDLIANNIKSPEIYKYLILNSIKGKRKKDLIDDLIYEMNKEFPEYSFDIPKY
jgi:tetratricopeptide (TPR) repeat protein